MNKPIKVLQVTGGFRKGVSGGIPSVIHNYCSSETFNGSIYFDYLSLGYQTFEPYRHDLERNGGELYCLNIHSNGKKQLFDIYFKLSKFLHTHHYDIVHVNSGALTQVLVCCIAAKKAGVNKVIAHSHNAITKHGLKGKIYDQLKPLFNRYADAWFACSKMAADCMFPSNIINDQKWMFIPNAIDMERFRYNEQIRDQYRSELGIKDNYVIGHVGRFNEQKNHSFLVETFAEIASKRDDARLLLVGEGALKDNVQKKCKDLNIENKVIFTGQRPDANHLMQAMDVFAFPSLFEGLGMVLVEAQIAGLKVVANSSLPAEACISENIKYLELSVTDWAKFLCEANYDYNRESDSKKAIKHGGLYDLTTATIALKKVYLSTCIES